jgi:chromosome segregation ATPase
MADNPLANAVKALMDEIAREEGRQKANATSVQATQAHLAALTKERDDMVASLEKETAKLQAAQAQTAAAQKQIRDIKAQATAEHQRVVAAAQAEADRIIRVARSEYDRRITEAQVAVDGMQKQLDNITAKRDDLLKQAQAAAARLDAMKKAAREFAGA